MNTLFYSDNLKILRKYVPDESVDLIYLEPPTSGMLKEAAALGKWQMPGSQRKYPVMQIFTVEEYFDKRMPDLPDTSETIKRAKREVRESEKQEKLNL